MPLDSSTQIQITYNGQVINVWDEAAEEEFDRNGASRAIRRVRCAWDDRLKLAAAIMGGTTNISGTNLFVKGLPYADQPTWTAAKIRTKGEGVQKVGVNGMVGYERAELTIIYTPFWYDETGIGAEEITIGSVAVATSQTQPSFKWTSDNAPIEASSIPSVRYTTMEFTEEVQVALLPRATIAGLIDHRNNAVFLDLPANTILFTGARSSRSMTVIGTTNYKISYNFSYLSVGWNKLFRPSTGGFAAFTWKDGSELFPATDLNQLFVPNGHFSTLGNH